MPVGGQSFGSVRKAREVLKERAEEIVRMYFETWKQALASGDFETAQKCASDLAKHIPKDEDGLTVFDIDVDKPKQVESKQSGPGIVIGVQIGGLNQKALPEVTVIDVPVDQDPPTDS